MLPGHPSAIHSCLKQDLLTLTSALGSPISRTVWPELTDPLPAHHVYFLVAGSPWHLAVCKAVEEVFCVGSPVSMWPQREAC